MATYLSIHSGAQIDSAVTTVLATSNWDTLQAISSSGGNVSVGSTVLADQAYVDSHQTTINNNSGAIVLSGGTNVSITPSTSGGSTTFTFDAQGGTIGDYLPLSGGTVSGGITVVDDVVISSGGSTIASLRELASGGGGGGAVASVNGKTGTVVLSALDVNAISTPTSGALTTIQTSGGYAPAQLCVYSHTVTSGEAIAFDDPADGEPVEFKLDLTVPDPVVPFSFVSAGSSGGVTWPNGAPDFSSAGGYQLYFEYDNGWYGWQRPDMSEYALKSEYLPLSGGTVTGRLSVAGGLRTGSLDAGVAFGGGTATNGTFAFRGRAAQTAAVAIGHETEAEFANSLAFGRAVKTVASNSVALGVFNISSANTGVALVVGCGTASTNKKDGLIVYKDGVGTDILGNVSAVSGGFITMDGDYVVSSGGSTVASLKDVTSRVNTLETTISGALASI